jgi:DNA end-binding protein Ku
LTDLIRAKQAGRKIQAPASPKTTNVVSLLDALRESAGQKPKAKAKPAASKPTAAKAPKSGAKAPATSRRKAS